MSTRKLPPAAKTRAETPGRAAASDEARPARPGLHSLAVATVRRKASGMGEMGTQDAPSSVDAAAAVAGSSAGAPLDAGTRSYYEARFGRDLGGVRVHTGAAADQAARGVGALAYTVGRDVVFRSGGFAPQSAEGSRLLAHELAHTLQPAAPDIPGARIADDPAAEAEADRAAAAVTARPADAAADGSSRPALGAARPSIARETPKDVGKSDHPAPPKDAPEPRWAKKLDEIMPKGRGLVGTIIRETTLVAVLGDDQLTDVVDRIAADPAARDFVKQAGVSAIAALADTRVSAELNVPAAVKALKDDPDRYSLTKGLKSLHVLSPTAKVTSAGPTLWFNDPAAPAPTTTGGITSSAQMRQQTFVDDTTPAFGGVKVQFAYSASQVNATGVSAQVQAAKAAVSGAVAQVIADLGNYEGGDVDVVLERQRVRARLKEALKGFDAAHPLRIYLAVDLTPDEMMKGLAAQTDRVWIDTKDVGDPKKLQAAIRIPLTMLTGGFLPGGGGQQVQGAGKDELTHTMMHELVHRMLIQRNSDAEAIWNASKAKITFTGPANQVTLMEALVRKFLIAQEEVFAYDNEAALYPPVSRNRSMYAAWANAAERFLTNRGAVITGLSKKIPVSEKVDKKAVDWQIDYKVPEVSYTLTGPDRTDAASLLGQYPG